MCRLTAASCLVSRGANSGLSDRELRLRYPCWRSGQWIAPNLFIAVRVLRLSSGSRVEEGLSCSWCVLPYSACFYTSAYSSAGLPYTARPFKVIQRFQGAELGA